MWAPFPSPHRVKKIPGRALSLSPGSAQQTSPHVAGSSAWSGSAGCFENNTRDKALSGVEQRTWCES